jgi:tetratricopeptide (TPR) repeat protein
MRVRVAGPWWSLAILLASVACGGGSSDQAGQAGAARDLYEQGLVFEERRIGVEDWRAAEDLYERAIEADSSFAPAYAGLARVHAVMVHFMYEPTPERRQRSRAAAEKALALQPGLPEGHYAMGAYHYWGNKQYDSAAVELALALETLGSDPRILAMAGFVERRRGEFERSLDYMERAARIDPIWVGVDLGDTYAALGRLDDALRAYAVIQSVQPEGHHEVGRGLIRLRHEGTTDSLRAALAALPAGFDPDGITTRARLDLAWAERRPEDALQAIAAFREPVVQDQSFFWPKSLLSGRAHRLAGRQAQATSAFDSARVMLQAAAAERPEEARVHIALAGAYAALGQTNEAVRAAERALQLMPYSRDVLNAQLIQLQAAAVHAEVGQHQQAIAMLEELFSRPVFNYARHYLTLDPSWDAIRQLPAFGRIVAGA